ncbi:MAG: PAS domain S-box protein [Rhodospirillales bacterium]|nr:PAS domain S-box protein [Rhodospirillales bacterium]
MDVVPEPSLQTKGENDYFKEAIKLPPEKVYLSEITLNKEFGQIETPHKPVLRGSIPLYTLENKLFGVLVINVSIKNTLSRFAQETPLHSNLYVIDEHLRFLSHPDPQKAFSFEFGQTDTIAQLSPALAAAIEQSTADQPIRYQTPDNVIQCEKTFYDPMVPERFLGICLELPDSVISLAITKLKNQTIWITSFLIAAGLMLSFIFSRQISRPLKQIADAAKTYSLNSTNFSLPVHESGEIGEIARNFQKMKFDIDKQAHELQQTFQSLRNSEERYNMAVKAANMAVWEWNIIKDDIYWGGWSHSLFGTDSLEKLPKTISEFIQRVHPDDKFRLIRAYLRHTIQHQSFDIEFRIKLFFGGYIWVSARARVQSDKNGCPLSLTGTLSNINARKKAEEMMLQARKDSERVLVALAENEERLALAIDGTSDGLWDWNVTTNEVFYSPRFRHLLGYEPDNEKDFPGILDSFIGALHPEDSEYTRKSIEDHLHNPEAAPFDVEFRLRTAQGEYHNFRARGGAVKNAEGQVVRMAGSLSDITTEKLNEREAISYQKRLTAILERAADGIITINTDGIVEQYNQACEDIFGWSAEEVIGQNVSLLVPEIHKANHDSYIQNYIKTGDSGIIGIGREVSALKKDGSSTMIYLAVSDIEIEGNRLFTAVLRDITEHKKYEQELKTARETAENATKAKSEFLASMSHEIRTPMNGIIGTASLLKNTELNEKQNKYVQTIAQSGDVLLTLLNDILDYSKIEAGKFSLTPSPFETQSVFDDVYELFRQPADEKGLEFTLNIAPDVPPILIGDYTRLRQIASNLTSNAIKYTEKGSVTIDVTLEKTNKKTATLKMAVTDTGTGIPENMKDSVFEKFTRIESMHTKILGTGLGLAICTALVAMMDGNVGVESELGKGSTFWFTADLKIADKTEAQEAIKAHSIDMNSRFTGHILLVEDVPTNQFVVTDMLEQIGCTVDIAENGQEALEALDKNGSAYNLILMDCNMPVMNGYDATKAIRNRSDIPDIPIIALTANAFKEDIDKCYACGMNGFLPKPVKQEDLVSTLQAWLEKETAERPQEKTAKKKAVKKTTKKPASKKKKTADLDSWAGFDSTFMDMLAGRSPERLEKFVSLTLKDAAEQVKSIKKGIKNGDAAEIGEAAHALKSITGQAGASVLSDLCLQLEKMGKGGETKDADKIFKDLMAEYDLFTAKLDTYMKG